MSENIANINIFVDVEIKNKAQDVLADLGLDMTTAISLFLRQTIRKNGIPFDLISAKQQAIPRFGSMKGKMHESDDHDWFEPLEDFKEYMQILPLFGKSPLK
ncbi:MAG: type II toxin-antitoxin system RelB/DinJ family antitoxin [Defluviitaleaceae bacterium]|nr:type II toxin-antitoxin system RelB/DinJ family antitoxin [Defluviitaleaceae bacterium]